MQKHFVFGLMHRFHYVFTRVLQQVQNPDLNCFFYLLYNEMQYQCNRIWLYTPPRIRYNKDRNIAQLRNC